MNANQTLDPASQHLRVWSQGVNILHFALLHMQMANDDSHADCDNFIIRQAQ